MQGVEMDWEWPIDTGDKKDKIKLIRYMRVSRLLPITVKEALLSCGARCDARLLEP